MKITDSNNIKHKILKAPFYLFSKIILLILFIGIFDFISILTFDFMQIAKPQGWILSYEELFFMGSLLLQLFVVVYLFLKWSSDYYYFANQELLNKTGIFFHKIHAFDLAKVDSTSTQQTIFGRIFNYGTITLYFGNQEFHLRQIPDPEQFIKFINQYKNNVSN